MILTGVISSSAHTTYEVNTFVFQILKACEVCNVQYRARGVVAVYPITRAAGGCGLSAVVHNHGGALFRVDDEDCPAHGQESCQGAIENSTWQLQGTLDVDTVGQWQGCVCHQRNCKKGMVAIGCSEEYIESIQPNAVY